MIAVVVVAPGAAPAVERLAPDAVDARLGGAGEDLAVDALPYILLRVRRDRATLAPNLASPAVAGPVILVGVDPYGQPFSLGDADVARITAWLGEARVRAPDRAPVVPD